MQKMNKDADRILVWFAKMFLFFSKVPTRIEPVLADKEVLLTALNIKSMTFSGSGAAESDEEDDEDEIKANGAPGGDDSIVQQLMGGKRRFKKPIIALMVDLAFASNVRFLDDHELYMENVELYRVIFFAPQPCSDPSFKRALNEYKLYLEDLKGSLGTLFGYSLYPLVVFHKTLEIFMKSNLGP